jgi:hypothetical protein
MTEKDNVMPTFEQIHSAFTQLKLNPKQPQLEEIISHNGYHSYFYAKDVLKSRFIEGEKAISKIPNYSLAYARYVLNSRFIEGEETIYDSTNNRIIYEKFLKEKQYAN